MEKFGYTEGFNFSTSATWGIKPRRRAREDARVHCKVQRSRLHPYHRLFGELTLPEPAGSGLTGIERLQERARLVHRYTR